jgi:NAD(P)-dependent dehydrogenase (short-subunit alcohol dehydrogenase family)
MAEMNEFWSEAKLGPEAFDFTGRNVLVIGAGSSVGAEVARAFAEEGADVALTTATLDGEEVMAVRRLSKEIAATGRRSLELGVDVALGTNVTIAVHQVTRDFGPIDVLVVAPDQPFFKPAEKTTDSEWARVMNVNLNGVFYACRAVGKEMLARTMPLGREKNRGRIICVASALGERGMSNSAAYAAARAGVHSLVRTLAQEWTPHAITVNCIAPAWLEDTPGLGDPTPDVNQLVRYIPYRRPGRADEVAPMALWLASDASGYVTGQTIAVDGGLLCHL